MPNNTPTPEDEKKLSNVDEGSSDQRHDPHEDLPHDEGDFSANDEDFFVEDDELKKILKEHTPLQNAPSASPNEEIAPPVHDEMPKKQPSSKAAPSAPFTPSSVSAIPLSINIQIASISVPLDDVLQWKAGTEIVLDQPISPQVTLTVNGQAVGQAELIQVGDYFGARILSIHH